MSESVEGLRVAATRQNARGTLNVCSAGPAGRGAPAAEGGSANTPASTGCASVIVAPGSVSPARSPHDAVAARGRPFINAASSSTDKPRMITFMTLLQVHAENDEGRLILTASTKLAPELANLFRRRHTIRPYAGFPLR